MSLSDNASLITRLRALIASPHDECDDPWYSCPRSPNYRGHDDGTHCTCGKDARDALLSEVIAALQLASAQLVQQSVSRPVCRVCGGYGHVAQKRTLDDGYGEVEPCPACGDEPQPRPASPVVPQADHE